jgi:hypothetical protein
MTSNEQDDFSNADMKIYAVKSTLTSMPIKKGLPSIITKTTNQLDVYNGVGAR